WFRRTINFRGRRSLVARLLIGLSYRLRQPNRAATSFCRGGRYSLTTGRRGRARAFRRWRILFDRSQKIASLAFRRDRLEHRARFESNDRLRLAARIESPSFAGLVRRG